MFRHLKYADRNKIEALIFAGESVKYIAKYLGVHASTIYREIKRGKYERMDTELRMYYSYSSDIAQKDYEYKQTSKGAPLKIGNDFCFAKYVEDKIIKDRYSPDAVIGEIKEKNYSLKQIYALRLYIIISSVDCF